MERTVTVYHEGAIAYYNVSKGAHGSFRARLLTYSGSSRNAPAQDLKLQKDGSRWVHDDVVDRELAEELGYVIEMQKASFDNTSTRYPSQYDRTE